MKLEEVFIDDLAMVQVQTVAHIQHSLNYSVLDVKWIPSTAKFLSVGSKSNGKGILQILELDSPNLELVKEVELESPLKCCSFDFSSHFVTGDFAGDLKIL